MALKLQAVTFAVPDVPAAAAFWAALLDRAAVADRDGVLLPGSNSEVGLGFEPTDTPGPGRNRLHLHLTSTSIDDQQATVRRALDLGGRHLDVGQLPEEKHLVLADPAGNEFCVIEPGNPFLAGCGFLAEVTCDGTRDAGRFWRDALGWTVVWDRDAQLAIQGPHGGTKLSWDSWGEPSSPPQPEPDRQRFDLAAENPTAQVGRLVELGATAMGTRGGAVALTDPDGRVFTIRER